MQDYVKDAMPTKHEIAVSPEKCVCMYVYICCLLDQDNSFGVGARMKRWLNSFEWVNETLPHPLSL